MTFPDWLTQDPDGHIHLTGHRISMEDIVYFFSQGDSPEMLHCRFPTVALPLFYKVIAFYLENAAEVDEYCAKAAAAVAEERAKPQPGPSLAELRRRREARRLSQGA
jgi:uncharacterized protein (DUF433 family)